MLFCHITSQLKTDKDQDLLQKKGGLGFPYLVFMDADGNVLARHEGDRTVDAFEKSAQKANAFVELRKKAEGGDKAAKAEYFMQALDLGHFTVEEGRRKLAELPDLTADQKKQAEEILSNLEVQEILSKVTEDEATQIEAGRKLAEMKKAGRAPSDEQMLLAYWGLIQAYAEKQKDIPLFEDSLKAIKELFGEQAAEFVAEKEKVLEKLKAEKK